MINLTRAIKTLIQRKNMNLELKELDDYCDSIINSSNPKEIKTKLQFLTQDYKFLTRQVSTDFHVWRARKLTQKSPFLNVRELSYPPTQITGVGRLNNANEPIFYGSIRKETALAEIELEAGDFVQLAGFRFVENTNINLAMMGQYWYVFKTGRFELGEDPEGVVSKLLNTFSPEAGYKTLYIDRFLAELLSARNASDKNYLHTRILTKIIFERTNAEAIFYPSIKDKQGLNIAIKPLISDMYFKNSSCGVLEVNKKLRYGMYDYDSIYTARGLDENNNFIWLDKPMEKLYWAEYDI